MDPLDLLEFLLCVFQKDEYCLDLKLDPNTYTIYSKFKGEFGNIGVKMDIRKVDDEVCVVEFSKLEGP